MANLRLKDVPIKRDDHALYLCTQMASGELGGESFTMNLGVVGSPILFRFPQTREQYVLKVEDLARAFLVVTGRKCS